LHSLEKVAVWKKAPESLRDRVLSFDAPARKEDKRDRAVYGLFKRDLLPFHSHPFICLYAGQTDHLRTRMLEDYNNFPITGVINFFSEAVTIGRQGKERGEN